MKNLGRQKLEEDAKTAQILLHENYRRRPRKYAAEQGSAEEEVLKKGIETKSKEFVENAAEVCA